MNEPMRDFDLEIQKKEEELENLKIGMNDTFIAFKEESKDFLEKWYSKESRNLIVNNPDKTIKLGEDRLKLLKVEVNELIANSSKIVDRYIDSEFLWWHKKENDHSYHYGYTHRLPDYLDSPFRFMLGEIGQLFSNYGVVKISHEHVGDYETSYSLKNGKVRYKFSYDINKELLDAFKKYAEQCREAISLKEAIKKIQEEKQKASIEDLWDSL